MTHQSPISKRPRSPHIQIYGWAITMAMSIAHRMTGAALYIGTIFIVLWLMSIAIGPNAFYCVQVIYSSWFGKLILFFYSFALIHHMYGGIRHLFWDIRPSLMQKDKANFAAWFTIIASIITTLSLWILAYYLH